MPCLRPSSATAVPAFCSFRIPMICSSVYRDRFIRPSPLWSGLYLFTVVYLSGEYFTSLVQHAVPLDERAIGALSHSAIALDIYSWLAQRLNRISKPHHQLVAWAALKAQFGSDFDRVRKFREKFVALRRVAARVSKCENTGRICQW